MKNLGASTNRISRITIRDAESADVPTLTALKGEGSEAVHQDRLRDAASPSFRYLVVLVDGELVGYGCLVFSRPAHWSDAADAEQLPQMVDLRVAESHRGQGCGSALNGAMERIAAEAGSPELYVRVEALDNPRAFDLYRRLDYRPLQTEPYPKHWEFTDSSGKLYRGEDRLIDLVKPLTR
jgi:ribosomal protein S18 acetylase RimI-like enzyme